MTPRVVSAKRSSPKAGIMRSLSKRRSRFDNSVSKVGDYPDRTTINASPLRCNSRLLTSVQSSRDGQMSVRNSSRLERLKLPELVRPSSKLSLHEVRSTVSRARGSSVDIRAIWDYNLNTALKEHLLEKPKVVSKTRDVSPLVTRPHSMQRLSVSPESVRSAGGVSPNRSVSPGQGRSRREEMKSKLSRHYVRRADETFKEKQRKRQAHILENHVTHLEQALDYMKSEAKEQ